MQQATRASTCDQFLQSGMSKGYGGWMDRNGADEPPGMLERASVG
ncbi:hypothetical protein L839_4642 [Mycobacterium avium MAV_120809_2495]|nr:hypothetical protein L839_4642 [Mycobacterium avium MAV_120809_2495]